MSEAKVIMGQKELPVLECDVAVVGGGTGGIIAAIAAARTGCKTVLVEAKGYLGGTVVEGGTALHSFFNNWKAFGREKIQLVRGIPEELIQRCTERGGCTGHCEVLSNYEYDSACTGIDTEIFKLVAHEMVNEAGVNALMNTVMVDAVQKNGVVETIIVNNHSGLSAVKAKVFIDATAYGDLCARAGAEYIEPNDRKISAPIGVAGVDMDRYAEYCASLGARTDFCYGLRDGEPGGVVRSDAKKELFPEEFQKENEEIGMSLTITTTRKHYFMFVKIDYKLPVSPTNRDAMSAAELELRRRQEKAIKLIRKYIPGCEGAYIARSTPNACIRRGRCIICDYDISIDDITSGRHFEDDVFEYGFHDEAPRYNIAQGGSYGFPYRAMLPKALSNVYATGMMVTTEEHAHMSTRNTVSCMAQGQAAGTAAALCVKNSCVTRELPYAQLRKKLIEDNVYLT